MEAASLYAMLGEAQVKVNTMNAVRMTTDVVQKKKQPS